METIAILEIEERRAEARDAMLGEGAASESVRLAPDTPAQDRQIWRSLPKLLRVLGACVLIAAAACFLLQGWGAMNHITRYFHFLLFTGLLSASGFFCGLRLREDKGARTFLAISAAVIPVHFSQLGALIYSVMPESQAIYPAWLLWKAPSLGVALSTTIAGILCLLPIAYIAFSSLARSEAPKLTLSYLLAGAALLIPTRDPDRVALIGLALALGATYFEVFYASRKAIMRTAEGGFVRAMMFAPLALLIGRTLNLYSASCLFVAMTLAGASLFLFLVVPANVQSQRLKAISQHLSTVTAFAAWTLTAGQFHDSGLIAESLLIPAILLPYSALLGLMSLSVASGEAYRRNAAILVVGSAFLELANFPGFPAAFICMASSLAVLVYAFMAESRYMLLAGLGGFCAGLIYTVRFAFELLPVSPWLCLAALGMAIVLSSSYLEKNHVRILERGRGIRGKLAEWN